MPRLPRLKASGTEAWYHIYASAAAQRGVYPLEPAACRRELTRLIEHYTAIYFCDVAAFCVLGNHYHMVVRFEKKRKLTEAERWKRALRMYPRSERRLSAWTQERWTRFEQRLFDMSEYMRNIQSAFGRWYNRTYDRKGRFWGDRFKSTLLAGGEAVLDCMLYVDLNPVRAGLCERPEDYEGSSVHRREMMRARWLLGLAAVVKGAGREVYSTYKQLLYYRGAVPTKAGQAAIPADVLSKEQARGFKREGTYRRTFRYFTDGLVVGSEVMVRRQLVRLRQTGRYLRRKNPVDQASGGHFSLREQRSNFVSLS